MTAGQVQEERVVVLPCRRGPYTASLYELFGVSDETAPGGLTPEPTERDVLDDDDFQLALYLCYELHYAGLAGVDERLEWSPDLIAFRNALERPFEDALRQLAHGDGRRSDSVGEELQRLVREAKGPPLSRYMETSASLPELLEHVVHRSAYQLKEADPHSWGLPRLTGAAKAALVEIQADEYGGGRRERMHAVLFANTMRGLGLDDSYGAYIDRLPGITLATVNLVTMFGLHRRLRGALTGHLAVFEMTSALPNRRYANGFRRFGFGPDVTEFYDEHVEADSVHESIATWDLADGLGSSCRTLADDILFGARALLALEGRWASHLLSAWSRDESSLLRSL